MVNNYMFHIYLGDNVADDSLTRENVHGGRFYPMLHTDKAIWDEITQKAVEFGFNSVLVELDDGVRYQSHPEIAVEGAWEVEALKTELQRLRSIGLTPYPKLNFSTAHDAWLGVYSHMVSTKTYYEVARDIIHEVIDIFDTPEMLHLGYDDEDWQSQLRYDYVCYRQFDLYWHDYRFFLNTVREKGVRPCLCVDAYALDRDKFLEHTPKDVIISPNYYKTFFEDASLKLPRANQSLMKKLESYKELPALGYEILPACSTYYSGSKYNVGQAVKYINKEVDQNAVRGILVETLQPVVMAKKYFYYEAFSIAKNARETL